MATCRKCAHTYRRKDMDPSSKIKMPSPWHVLLQSHIHDSTDNQAAPRRATVLATSGLSTQPPVHAVCAAIRILSGSWQQIAAMSDTCMIALTSLTDIPFISRFVSATIKHFAKVCLPRPLLRAGSCLRRLLFWSRPGQILAARSFRHRIGLSRRVPDSPELSIRVVRQTAEVSSVKGLHCVPLPRQS